MDVLRLLVRSDARRRWRAHLFIAVLVATAVASIAVPLSGARRATSAIDRFAARSNVWDVEIGATGTEDTLREEVRARPEVRDSADYRLFFADTGGDFNFIVVASPDGAFDRINRPHVVDGRMPAPNALDEIVVNEAGRIYGGFEVGDTIDATTPSQEQFDANDYSGEPAGPDLRLRVVGVVRMLEQLEPQEDAAVALASPAFYDQYADSVGGLDGNVYAILRPGASAGDFEAGLREDAGAGTNVSVSAFADRTKSARDAVRVQAYALFAMAFVLALIALVVVGQVLARDVEGAREDEIVWLGLGLSASQRITALVAGRAVPVLAGSLGGIVVAAVLSPLLPFGLARRADLDVGFHADWIVLLGVAFAASAVGIGWTWVVSRSLVRTRSRVVRQPGLVDATARTLPVPIGLGLMYALRPNAGRRAVPARSVLLGVVVASVGVVGATTFSRTLDRAATTPTRWGWAWDSRAETTTDDIEAIATAVRDDPGVADAALMNEGGVVVNGLELQAYGLEDITGSVSFTLRAGRMPTTPDEVALGPHVLRSLDLAIGDTAQVPLEFGGAPIELRVVGSALGPSFEAAPAEQALFTHEGLDRVRQADGDETVVLRYRPGQQEEAEARLGAGDELLHFSGAGRPHPPEDLNQYIAIDAVPAYLALFFGLLATMALVHVLAVTGRRRVRELAVLRAFGLPRRQIVQVLLAQGVTIVVVAMIVGIPLGLVAGRMVWREVADRLGLSADIVVPVALFAALFAAALVTATVVAFFASGPSRRVVPAVALRSE